MNKEQRDNLVDTLFIIMLLVLLITFSFDLWSKFLGQN
jgi:hypothetical protein